MVGETGRSAANFWLNERNNTNKDISKQSLNFDMFVSVYNVCVQEKHGISTKTWTHSVPAYSTAVSTVHKEYWSECSGHSHVGCLTDQNHDGLNKL